MGYRIMRAAADVPIMPAAMSLFELLLLLLIGLVVMVLIVSPSKKRGDDKRVCGSCGAAHPPFARFCRRCGKEL